MVHGIVWQLTWVGRTLTSQQAGLCGWCPQAQFSLRTAECHTNDGVSSIEILSLERAFANTRVLFNSMASRSLGVDVHTSGMISACI